ncbi:MAG: hypothetical protein QXX41_01195 [Nitrososphaerota archaeon]
MRAVLYEERGVWLTVTYLFSMASNYWKGVDEGLIKRGEAILDLNSLKSYADELRERVGGQ